MGGEDMATRFARQRAVVKVLAVAFVIELVTIIFRFGLGMATTQTTASTIGRLTLGVRIHHGYIGVVMVLIWWVWGRMKPGYWVWVPVLGWALILSDLVHHFLVLWTLTGDPEFHLFYSE